MSSKHFLIFRRKRGKKQTSSERPTRTHRQRCRKERCKESGVFSVFAYENTLEIYIRIPLLSSALCFFRFLSAFFSPYRISTLYARRKITYTHTERERERIGKRTNFSRRANNTTIIRSRERRDWSRRLISDRFTFDY